MLHHAVELVGAEPGDLDVLRAFETRRGEVTLHLDEIVQLPSLDTVVADPDHFPEL